MIDANITIYLGNYAKKNGMNEFDDAMNKLTDDLEERGYDVREVSLKTTGNVDVDEKLLPGLLDATGVQRGSTHNETNFWLEHIVVLLFDKAELNEPVQKDLVTWLKNSWRPVFLVTPGSKEPIFITNLSIAKVKTLVPNRLPIPKDVDAKPEVESGRPPPMTRRGLKRYRH